MRSKLIRVLRKGPSLEFATSMRWINPKADQYGKGFWKPFRKSIVGGPNKSHGTCKTVHISQGLDSACLAIEVDRYVPEPTDQQVQERFQAGVPRQYRTEPFSIADPDSAIRTIEMFLQNHTMTYIDARLQHATELTKGYFEMAKKNQDVCFHSKAAAIK